jgi:hypothetical protein
MFALRFFILIVLLTSVSFSTAQSNVIDSLQRLLKNSEDDSSKVLLLNDLLGKYSMSDPDKAMEYGMKAISLSEKLNYARGLGNSYNNVALIYINKGEFGTSLNYYLKIK